MYCLLRDGVVPRADNRPAVVGGFEISYEGWGVELKSNELIDFDSKSRIRFVEADVVFYFVCFYDCFY